MYLFTVHRYKFVSKYLNIVSKTNTDISKYNFLTIGQKINRA